MTGAGGEAGALAAGAPAVGGQIVSRGLPGSGVSGVIQAPRARFARTEGARISSATRRAAGEALGCTTSSSEQ